MLHKNIIAIMAGTVLALASCRKPVDEPQTPPATPRVSKITYPYESVSYAYHADGSLKSATIRDNNGSQAEVLNYSYQDGRIREAASAEIKLLYSYPAAGNTRIELINNFSGKTFYFFDFKTVANRLTEWTMQTQTANGPKLESKVVNTYNEAGNIVQSEHFQHVGAGWVKSEIVSVQYDNKRNHTSHLEAVHYFLGQHSILANNPVKEEYKTPTGVVFKTVTYQHTYDAAGRKVKTIATTKETGVPDTIEAITYEYQ